MDQRWMMHPEHEDLLRRQPISCSSDCCLKTAVFHSKCGSNNDITDEPTWSTLDVCGVLLKWWDINYLVLFRVLQILPYNCVPTISKVKMEHLYILQILFVLMWRRLFPVAWPKAGDSIEWPPWSPDLTLMDFFLWGKTKNKKEVYDRKSNTTCVQRRGV